MTVSLNDLQYNPQGLLPAIVQDRLTGEVRMMAWMSREAIKRTMETGWATFFSRSRSRLWVKGEASGNRLRVSDLLADCDADTLLVLCDPEGPSCHTGQDNCFFQPVFGTESGPAKPFMNRLELTLAERQQSPAEKSYTRSLLDGGAQKIGSKLREEAGELAEALDNEGDDRVTNEAADVVYHLLVGLRLRNLPWRGVVNVLARRFGVSGHDEKASRG